MERWVEESGHEEPTGRRGQERCPTVIHHRDLSPQAGCGRDRGRLEGWEEDGGGGAGRGRGEAAVSGGLDCPRVSAEVRW